MSDLIYGYVRDRNTLDRREFESRLRSAVLVYKTQKQVSSARETLEFVGGRDFSSILKIVRREAHQYRVIKLRSDDHSRKWTIGRDDACDLVINHPAVSKAHAMVSVLESGEVYLVDQRSRNGTHLNGSALPADVPRRLITGDVMRFGEIDVQFLEPQGFFDFLTSLLEPRLVDQAT